MIRRLLPYLTLLRRRGPGPFTRPGACLTAILLLASHLAPLVPPPQAVGESARPGICRPAMRCSKDPNGCCCRKPLDEGEGSRLKCTGGEAEPSLLAKLFLPAAIPLTHVIPPARSTLTEPYPARGSGVKPVFLPASPPTPPPEAAGWS